MFEDQNNSLNDVATPGTTAAAPFSRPIIVTDHPAQADPMVAEQAVDLSLDPAPTAPLADFAERAAAVATETPEHFHSLQPDQPFVHSVKHRSTSIVGILATILFMAAAAFAGYYITKVYLLG